MVTNKVFELSPNINLERLNILGFLRNLLPVTLGNIIGGALMVAAVYWLIIVLPERLNKKHKLRGNQNVKEINSKSNSR